MPYFHCQREVDDESLPSGVQCQRDLEVGEDGPEQGLNEADGEPDEGGGQHKRPGREEQVVPLFEEHRHTINSECPAGT